MLKKFIYNEQDNDWAKNIAGEHLHISQAESGANNYFCLGCDKEMLAAKGNIKKHYFRHVVKDVDNPKVECVHASRVYREKLAYFYFQRTKTITVPAVYKYPPRGVEGHPMLIREKETIIAHKVEKEVTFYEDENGVIHRGKNTNVDERFLWVRPDAVFFDKDDKPILFIEFVITHKPDTDKLNKLQRLGINTVQIIIPKLPEEELENAISKVSKVKWAYNEIESNTNYIPVLTGNPEGVPFIDEEQRKLFEESYKCRAAQIKNLIRSISRILESKSYRDTEQLFELEIQRIENATREHQSRLDELQATIENEVHEELRSRSDLLAERRRKHEQTSADLERRYFKRREEIREEQGNTEREIKLKYNNGRTEAEIRREFETKEADIDYEQKIISRQEDYIDIDTGEESELESNFESRKAKLREEFGELEKFEREKFRKFERAEQEEFNELQRTTKPEYERHTAQQIEIENELRSEFEGRYQQIADRISERDIQTGDELSERIKAILDLRGILHNYDDAKSTLTRYRKGISLIKSGTWKD